MNVGVPHPQLCRRTLCELDRVAPRLWVQPYCRPSIFAITSTYQRTILNPSVPAADTDAAGAKSRRRRTIIASMVGTTIEWYDFNIYGAVAALAFGKIFFPDVDPARWNIVGAGHIRSRIRCPSHRWNHLRAHR